MVEEWSSRGASSWRERGLPASIVPPVLSLRLERGRHISSFGGGVEEPAVGEMGLLTSIAIPAVYPAANYRRLVSFRCRNPTSATICHPQLRKSCYAAVDRSQFVTSSSPSSSINSAGR